MSVASAAWPISKNEIEGMSTYLNANLSWVAIDELQYLFTTWRDTFYFNASTAFVIQDVNVTISRRLPWLVPEGSNLKAAYTALTTSFENLFPLSDDDTVPDILWIFSTNTTTVQVPDFLHNTIASLPFYCAVAFAYENSTLVFDPFLQGETFIEVSDWISLIDGAYSYSICDPIALTVDSPCYQWNLLQSNVSVNARLNAITNDLVLVLAEEYNQEYDRLKSHLSVISSLGFYPPWFCSCDVEGCLMNLVVCDDDSQVLSLEYIQSAGSALLQKAWPVTIVDYGSYVSNAQILLEQDGWSLSTSCIEYETEIGNVTADYVDSCECSGNLCARADRCSTGITPYVTAVEQTLLNVGQGDALILSVGKFGNCRRLPLDSDENINTSGLSLFELSKKCDSVIQVSRILIDGGPSYNTLMDIIENSYLDQDRLEIHTPASVLNDPGTSVPYLFSHVLLTHMDEDHSKGIIGLFKEGPKYSAGDPGNVWYYYSDSTLFYWIDPLNAAGYPTGQYSNNGISIVFQATLTSSSGNAVYSALFTGDATGNPDTFCTAVQQPMQYVVSPGVTNSYTFVKAPHHGASTTFQNPYAIYNQFGSMGDHILLSTDHFQYVDHK
ncbi:hypothetical protein HDU83_006072 [Entophlyctis luteolus]|nr:hypothetical protein HDU83_006072 [Entophlyctis luteolus]